MKDKKSAPVRKTTTTIIRMIKQLYSASPFAISIMFLTLILTSVIPFILTLLNTKVIDEIVNIVSEGSVRTFSENLIKIAIAYVVTDFILTIVFAAQSYYVKQMFYTVQELFTLQFLHKSSNLDMYNYESSDKNDLIQKAKDAYQNKPYNFMDRFIQVFGHFISLITSFGIIATFNFSLFLIVVVCTIPVLIINIKFSNTAWGIWNANIQTKRRFYASSGLLTSESALQELKIFKTKDYVFNLIKNLYSDFFTAEKEVNLDRSFYDSITQIISKLGITIFWLFTISEVINGNITVGLFAFYSSSILRFSGSLENFTRKAVTMYEDAKYMIDYYEFIDLKNELVSGTTKITKTKEPPRIEFKHVDFAYPSTSKKVLDNFELVISPGEKIAFVGENGAGKTTIIKLLTRFYDVTSGQILINGTDIRELDISDWYGQLGVLFQSFVKYQFLPAKLEIGLGDESRIDNIEQIKSAAEKSGAKDFIERFKNKYEQLLSKSFPNGTDLSGGQWQKMALARAFFRDAPILILDEPTSAIDAKGEYEIFEKLYEFSQGKTVIIVSHRFSTVRQADRILVVDKGKIVEQGSHEELMKLKGKYYKAFNRQAEGYR